MGKISVSKDFLEKSSYLILLKFYNYIEDGFYEDFDIDYYEPHYYEVEEYLFNNYEIATEDDLEFWEDLGVDIKSLPKDVRDELVGLVNDYFSNNYDDVNKYIYNYRRCFRPLFNREMPKSFIKDDVKNNCINLRQEIIKIITSIKRNH